MNNGTKAIIILDKSVDKDRFSMSEVIESLLDQEKDIANLYKDLQRLAGKRYSKSILNSMIRFSFFIELVKRPKIESTKYEVRWGERMDPDDPRYSSFEDCYEIFLKLAESLNNGEAKDKIEVLKDFSDFSQVSYELPIDYLERVQVRIHSPENVDWIFGEVPEKVVILRKLLLGDSNPYSDLFKSVYGKIQVKSYLTDRVLTGLYKTNREKRWETHPQSVNFALRRVCQDIEHKLISQICFFDKAPEDLVSHVKGVLDDMDRPVRCPITMHPFSFLQFEQEILSPTHGKASFQVGHLNPLKAINDDELTGHSAENVSWISSDGNRIQGHLTLDETRELISSIYENYQKFGIR